ncbi:hypothetical protein [Rhodococcus sp. NPDC057529]
MDTFGRTSMWNLMDGKAGLQLGILPSVPKNRTGGPADHVSPAQR